MYKRQELSLVPFIKNLLGASVSRGKSQFRPTTLSRERRVNKKTAPDGSRIGSILVTVMAASCYSGRSGWESCENGQLMVAARLLGMRSDRCRRQFFLCGPLLRAVIDRHWSAFAVRSPVEGGYRQTLVSFCCAVLC